MASLAVPLDHAYLPVYTQNLHATKQDGIEVVGFFSKGEKSHEDRSQETR